MLVLTRKIGEEIIIGANIRLMVVAVKGEKVRIGISAPKDIPVDRSEVHEARRSFFNDEPVVISIPSIIPL